MSGLFSATLAALVAAAAPEAGSRPWLAGPSARADPEAAARALLAKMTLEEKITMLHGDIRLFVQRYVGFVPGNARLGIPPINLNDGPQGFRSAYGGSATCWPSGMTVGWAWDVELAAEWGAAMGSEFFQKGANVALGPGLCLCRVPRNGRTFEYLSGEDPYFGSVIVKPVVQGIQSQGVVANAKHFITNNQETHRASINSVVDERTLFEMYYPPFVGAVEAGVGSFMCSYNKINGRWSCENNSTLHRDLKERIGFEGWVMSDWGATHSTSINEGLDQEMPGFFWMGQLALGEAVRLGKVSEVTVDASVLRILVPLLRVGVFDHAAHWSNASLHSLNVTSPEHSALARRIAAESAVLCKNKGGLLPLKPGAKSIAVVNAQAANPTVHGGGSGSVKPTYVVAPLDAITRRNSGGAVTYSDGSDRDKATAAAAKADVAVVFVATSSTEGFDRQSLSFDDGDDALVAAVAKAQPYTVVVGVTPGPVLTPWSPDVAALLLVGMPGLEYGNAIADVLFGSINPSGHLTVTMPNRENEMNMTESQWPGVDGASTYSEGLLVGYRYYDQHRINFTTGFPFGHGLSYTTFAYAGLRVADRTVALTVANTGGVVGAEVVQLYLGFPPSAGEPPQQLKGFAKVLLAPGERQAVRFNVTERDTSVWSTAAGAWVPVRGTFAVRVGASSRDIRLETTAVF